MSKKRLLNEIAKNGADRRSETLKEIQRRYPQCVKVDSQQKERAKRKNLVFTKVVPTLSAIVCAITVTVSAVLCKVAYDNSRFGYTEVKDYYFTTLDVGYTIKDYAKDNGLNYKCLDRWYDFAEDITSYTIHECDTDKFIGVRETMYDPQNDNLFYLDIISANVYVDTLERIYADITQSRNCGKFDVRWSIDDFGQHLGAAQYEGYKYYMIFYQPSSDEVLFDTFKELLG